MTRPHSSLAAAAVFASTLLAARPGHGASTSVERVRLVYRAPSSCPSRAFFTRQVRARTARVRFARTGAERHFSVSIETRAKGFFGRLEIVDQAGRANTRSFQGRACSDVVAALALVTALAIDPHASTAPVASLPPPVVPPARRGPGRAARPRARRKPDHLGWQWSSGVDLTMMAGPAARPLLTFAPFLETERERAAPWRPSLRLQLLAAATGVLGPGAPRARYRWFAARIELCPVDWPLYGKLSMIPCVASDLGALAARGTAVALPRSAIRGWWAVGLTARLRWATGRGFFVEIAGNGYATITRDSLVFETPHELVHQAPPISLGAQLGAGVNFL